MFRQRISIISDPLFLDMVKQFRQKKLKIFNYLDIYFDNNTFDKSTFDTYYTFKPFYRAIYSTGLLLIMLQSVVQILEQFFLKVRATSKNVKIPVLRARSSKVGDDKKT